MPRHGWTDILRRNSKVRDSIRQQCELNAARLEQIRRNYSTRLIRYPEHNEAFDYVHRLYPFANVRLATVYQTPRHVVEDAGYGGVGGFYDTKAKVVVITDGIVPDGDAASLFTINAEITEDEVLVHELIHYSANYKNPTANRAVEEEIAYGKSVDYLRWKGRTDYDIIRKNMMPYLVNCINKWAVVVDVLRRNGKLVSEIGDARGDELDKKLAPYRGQIMESCIEQAHKLGERIIAANATKAPFDPNKTTTPAEDGDLLKAEKRKKIFLLDDDIV